MFYSFLSVFHLPFIPFVTSFKRLLLFEICLALNSTIYNLGLNAVLIAAFFPPLHLYIHRNTITFGHWTRWSRSRIIQPMKWIEEKKLNFQVHNGNWNWRARSFTLNEILITLTQWFCGERTNRKISLHYSPYVFG